jgi:hypothetical protein
MPYFEQMPQQSFGVTGRESLLISEVERLKYRNYKLRTGPALRPTLHPIQWFPRFLPGDKAAGA